MPDIHIQRDHQLGLQEARKIASSWAEKAEKKFDMECTYEEGDTEDALHFVRSGVKGTLRVDAHQFDMTAQLGFLFGAFKDRIETEIGNQLDTLLGAPRSAATNSAAASAGKQAAPAPAADGAAPKAPRKAAAAKAATKAAPRAPKP